MEREVCCMPGYGTDLLQDGVTGTGIFLLEKYFFILIMCTKVIVVLSMFMIFITD